MAMGGDAGPPRPGDRKIVGVSWNANGLNERKRREMIEVFKKKQMDVMGVQETHMKGSGILECKAGGKCGVWEGMEGGVIWSGMKEGGGGRGKEGCALLMSERMWKGLEDWGRSGRLGMEGDKNSVGQN